MNDEKILKLKADAHDLFVLREQYRVQLQQIIQQLSEKEREINRLVEKEKTKDDKK